MKLEGIEILQMDLSNHINLLEYLASELDEIDESKYNDVKLYSHILSLAGCYLEKSAEKLGAYLSNKWEILAEKRRAKSDGGCFIYEVEWEDIESTEQLLDLVMEKSAVHIIGKDGIFAFRADRFDEILDEMVKAKIEGENR